MKGKWLSFFVQNSVQFFFEDMQKSGLSLTDIIGFEGLVMFNSFISVILVQLFSNKVSFLFIATIYKSYFNHFNIRRSFVYLNWTV